MKLTAERIVDAALAVYAERGSAGLSMRAVAARLDAQAGSLYYHVPDKAALLRLMADRIALEAHDAGTTALAALADPADWRASLTAQATAVRATIRRQSGGAELLAAAPSLASTGALTLVERLLSTLTGAGLTRTDAGVVADTVLGYVTGFVLQEQAERGPDVELDPHAWARLRAAFPVTFEQAAGVDDDETFARGLALLCAGAEALRATIDPP
ncbi:TetR/AcrR family transcriptional regulator C-terminal domain-containing protein [Cellulomonas alba]|uniref:TetR/AcrR family transcriptional regulator C-terminal domain-containing protein n=1 Tax=Cellulomonas alba TaxID=3053467 RepID=A0ABT7SK57_9CELL|nr:TetR/AcrR family transcriptional regulator C-terminal domain-containing protein [Cellulomonas alba]MDM7856571.1 TetR/AcrR family transcriptional regulator C-terminal domain-containing protein [Cellulomonas alba]